MKGRVVLGCVIAAALSLWGCGETTTFANPGFGPEVPDVGGDAGPGPDGLCRSDDACGTFEVCCRGQCAPINACDQVFCETQGQVCELTGGQGLEVQGDFYCALFGANPDPVCLGLCEKTFTTDGCASGSFCLNVSAGESALSLCLPSECSDSDQCLSQGPLGGTCVAFGNRAGFCFVAGNAPGDAACVSGGGDPSLTCAPGLFCTGGPDGSTCQPLCDMWQGVQGECPQARACGYLTLGTGVCRPQTRAGRELAESCDPVGDWCTSRAQCLDFQTGGEPLPVCTAYCRPGLEDCRGRFGDQQGFCRTVFTDGAGETVEDLGLCL